MVSTNKYKPNAKERILKTAVKIFAEKGFDAARVEKIAETAGVPKSLIYYHFKSKDEILETAIAAFYNEFRRIAGKIMEKADTGKKSRAELFRERYKEFLDDNADLVRVAFIESLKKEAVNSPMIRLADEYLAACGLENEDNAEAVKMAAKVLFANLVPTAAFICLKKQFCEKFSLNDDQADNTFADMLDHIVS